MLRPGDLGWQASQDPSGRKKDGRSAQPKGKRSGQGQTGKRESVEEHVRADLPCWRVCRDFSCREGRVDRATEGGGGELSAEAEEERH
jgi:hypothetical protein